MSIYLVHLPHPGTVLDQSAWLVKVFDVVKGALYRKVSDDLRRH